MAEQPVWEQCGATSVEEWRQCLFFSVKQLNRSTSEFDAKGNAPLSLDTDEDEQIQREAERWAHIVHGILTANRRLCAEANAARVANM